MALKAYSLARDGALHLTPHFRVREFACRDGSDPIFVEEELAALLEAIRLHFGCPVAITSGFRTAKAAPAAGYIWTPAAPKPAGRAESDPSSDLKFTTKIRKENPL